MATVFQGGNFITPILDQELISVGVLIINPSVDDIETVGIITEGGIALTLPVWAVRAGFPNVKMITTSGTTIAPLDMYVVLN